MKGIIIKKFRDKNTKSVYAVGDSIERDEARIAEINQTQGGPFIKVIKEADTQSDNESSTPAPEGDAAAGEKAARTPRSKKAKE